MVIYQQVEDYMKAVGMKYIKNSTEFISGLSYRTKDKNYTMEVATTLNSRAMGAPTDNTKFYDLKNQYYEASIYISSAFDGGVFRHIGNMVIDNPDLFKTNVLDMACDCGIVTCFMAKCYPDCKFVGVDINPKAIVNAKTLAEKLNLKNVKFVCEDICDMELHNKFDTVTSFRCLLDVADKQTKNIDRIGLREVRENNYKNAFMPYCNAINDYLNDNGNLLCVERYTAEYGWLGWLNALSENGINALDKCEIMKAQDISSVKEYSVTYAKKVDCDIKPIEIFNNTMAKQFKSGTGYDGGMAEFTLYYDSEGEIEFTDVYKNDKVIHQFAFANSKNEKRMFFDSSADSKKIKYYNIKKEESMKKDFNKKLSLYDSDEYSIKNYTV
jgi:SAM-dependent methyltransferase